MKATSPDAPSIVDASTFRGYDRELERLDTMMSRAAHHIIIGAVLVICGVTLALRASAESMDERTATRSLTRGDELLSMGRHQEAIDTWRAGLRVMPHWILLLRIGNAFRQMNRCEIALDYLRFGYDLRDDTFTDAMLPRLHQAINECTTQLPSRIDISANQGQVTVEVDGRELGITPLDPIDVPPGLHSIYLSRDGYTSAETTIRTTAATTTYVRLSLTPEDGTETTEIRSQPMDRLSRARRRRASLWGGLLIGSGLLVAGGGAALVALDGLELEGRQGISSLGPGVALVALGGLLIGGGITLFAVHPPARNEPANR